MIPYIGIFSRQEILAKMTLGRCVKCSLSPIFAISMPLNEDVSKGLFFAVSIFGDFREVANSAKIKPTRKIPDILYFANVLHVTQGQKIKCQGQIWKE